MKILRAIQSAFDAVDIVFFLGLVLIGYGASRIVPGAGWLIVGLFLVLYVRPLLHWVKK